MESVLFIGNLCYEPTADGVVAEEPGLALVRRRSHNPFGGDAASLWSRLALSGHTFPCIYFQILCSFYWKVTSELPKIIHFKIGRVPY